MGNWYSYSRSLRFRILLITALCWLIPTLILGWYMGHTVFPSIRAQTEALLLQALGSAEERQQLELQRVVDLSKSATYDNTLENTRAKYLDGVFSYNEFYRASRTYLDSKYFRDRAFTFGLFFLTDQSDLFMSTTESRAAVVEYREHAHAKVIAVGEDLDTRCRFLSANGHTYLIRNLYNRKLQRFGMLVLGINTDRLLNPLFEGYPLWAGRMNVAVDDYERTEAGDSLPTKASAKKLTELRDEILIENYIATRDYTLRYRVYVDKHIVYSHIEQMTHVMVLMIVLIFPIGALITVFVGQRIVSPLNRLANASRRIEGGELGVVVDIPSEDEVGQLARCYNGMSLQIKELVEKSFEEELSLRDARIEALQSRINPHFLNNTLEMINWQARIEGSETISRMIEAMSTLVNASLDRANARVVPLADELSVADAYFYFLDQRFGGRLTVEMDIDDALLSAMVPRLAIQTMLENAVDHGVGPAGGGRIRLSAHSEGSDLLIDVVNNGRSLSDADLARITELLSNSDENLASKLRERLGIRNINRRAQLIYGDRASLTIGTTAGGDTIARLRLPLGDAKS